MLFLLGACHLFSSPDIATCETVGRCGDTSSPDDTGDPTGDDTGDSGEPVDADGDGVPASEDCDDDDPYVSPELEEICGDGLDNDCDGTPNGCRLEGELDTTAAVLTISHSPGASTEYVGNEVSVLGDVDADGVVDLGVGVPYDSASGGTVAVLPADSEDMAWDAAAIQLYASSSSGVGQTLVDAGDVDGDGTADVLVGAYYFSGGATAAGGAGLFYGPLTGDSKLEDATLIVGDEEYGYIGQALAAGDLQGDGGTDIVIGSTTLKDGFGAIYLVDVDDLSAAGKNYASRVAHGSVTTDEDSRFGGVMSNPADLDGDGVAELMTTAPYRNGYAGGVYIFPGPVTSSLTTDDAGRVFLGSTYDLLGENGPEPVPDMDGDGLPELAIGAYYGQGKTTSYTGRTYVVPASASSGDVADAATATLYGVTSTGQFGQQVEATDFDGDGFGDVIVAAPEAGTISIFYGPLSGALEATEAGLTYSATGSSSGLGNALHTGDVNGDGVGELFVGEPVAGNGRGQALLFEGASF